jgi:hypothetical protein
MNWSGRADLNLRRFAGVSEDEAKRESAGEILSEGEGFYLPKPRTENRELRTEEFGRP